MKFQGDDNAACSLCLARGVHSKGSGRTTQELIQLFTPLTNTAENEESTWKYIFICLSPPKKQGETTQNIVDIDYDIYILIYVGLFIFM